DERRSPLPQALPRQLCRGARRRRLDLRSLRAHRRARDVLDRRARSTCRALPGRDLASPARAGHPPSGPVEMRSRRLIILWAAVVIGAGIAAGILVTAQQRRADSATGPPPS